MGWTAMELARAWRARNGQVICWNWQIQQLQSNNQMPGRTESNTTMAKACLMVMNGLESHQSKTRIGRDETRRFRVDLAQPGWLVAIRCNPSMWVGPVPEEWNGLGNSTKSNVNDSSSLMMIGSWRQRQQIALPKRDEAR